MEDFCLSDEVFDDDILNELVKGLRQSFNKSQESFCLLCYSIYAISRRFDDMPVIKGKKSGVLYNKYPFFELFGFDHSQVIRYCKCFEKYVKMCDVAQNLRPVFFGFTPSKLFELLPISNEQLEKDIESGRLQSSMTVKQIRQYVKEIKGAASNNAVYEDNEDNENAEEMEEIPQVFDPTKWYDIEYFESQSKDALINFCFQYQTRYVKR